MKKLDRILQNLRIDQALPYIKDGDRLLDIGCLDRVLLERVEGRVTRAVGIDPLAAPYKKGKVEILKTTIPGDHPFQPGDFDCITMLAVLEHIIEKPALARECFRLLAPGGRVVITVPLPVVDKILAVLVGLRLMEGMSLEEHHGYDVRETPAIFGMEGFSLLKAGSFELGLNRLFVFERPRVAVMQEGKPMAARGSTVSA